MAIYLTTPRKGTYSKREKSSKKNSLSKSPMPHLMMMVLAE
jgi:hypothetical protein